MKIPAEGVGVSSPGTCFQEGVWQWSGAERNVTTWAAGCEWRHKSQGGEGWRRRSRSSHPISDLEFGRTVVLKTNKSQIIEEWCLGVECTRGREVQRECSNFWNNLISRSDCSETVVMTLLPGFHAQRNVILSYSWANCPSTKWDSKWLEVVCWQQVLSQVGFALRLESSAVSAEESTVETMIPTWRQELVHGRHKSFQPHFIHLWEHIPDVLMVSEPEPEPTL